MCRGRSVDEQKQARSHEDGKNEKAQNGVDEPSPCGDREPRQRHSLGAKIDGGHSKVERIQSRAKAEDKNGHKPKCQPDLWDVKKRRDHSDYGRYREPEAETREARKRHRGGSDWCRDRKSTR